MIKLMRSTQIRNSLMKNCIKISALSILMCLSACDGQDSKTEIQTNFDMLLEVDMIAEMDMMTEAGMMVEADMMIEADMVAEVDMMSEVDMMLGPPACANGMDDDLDELIDYPRDPGCESLTDEDEEDPELFACEDGQDNDEDALVDLNDPGCFGPRDNSEYSACGPHEALDVSAVSRVVTDSEGESA